MCVLVLSTKLSKTFLILNTIHQDIIINVHIPSCEVPVIIVGILIRLKFFSICFRKITKYQISCKSIHWEPNCSMRTERRRDGQTDRYDEVNNRLLSTSRKRLKVPGSPPLPSHTSSQLFSVNHSSNFAFTGKTVGVITDEVRPTRM
jgi:hypothetical protein